MIRFVEELSINALPALKNLQYDGWLLRYANGYTRRANSVQPLYPSSIPLDEKIDYCEQIYHTWGIPTVFKMTEASLPNGLDAILAERGFEYHDGAIVNLCPLLSVTEPSTHQEADISAEVAPEWIADYGRLNQLRDHQRDAMHEVLRRLVTPAGFVTLHRDGVAVAIGLAVLERGYIGIFDIVVDPKHRGQGLGRQLMLHLLHWGKRNGAVQAYLQVSPTNTPALNLYGGVGFRESYRYWYRVRPA